MNEQTVVTYLTASGARDALAFYETAFGAEQHGEIYEEGDRIGHAEFRIGSTEFYISDECPELGVKSPTTLGGTATAMSIAVDDVDAAWARAMDAGASEDRPPQDQMGFRIGWLRDPFGHRWALTGPESG